MVKWISKGEWVDQVEYNLEFDRKDEPGSGWSFPCDSAGNVDLDTLAEPGRRNLARCRSGHPDIIEKGVVKRAWSWFSEPVIECDCGTQVVLLGFTNPCNGCGTDYNQSGQALAPRHLWGEETGEHWTECV